MVDAAHTEEVDAVLATLGGLIEQITDVAATQITSETRFDSFSDWTSHSALRLMVAIEGEFTVRLDLREYLEVQQLGQLAELVSSAREG
ncbi:phosphopantetheine-binding protein [Streptomyces sp. NPDC005438]|uniref:acyl carrier protein n=1 Tax=Streptomyces sp. NPDC005438 TaxID=3156880 RepID=UPI0033A891CC